MKKHTPIYKNERVGMYLHPHTRNRLNKLKAELALASGQVLSQDDVIVVLLDHYEATAQPQAEYA